MAASIFLSFREGLEAALIIGIIFSVLTLLGEDHLKRYIWYGTISAAGLSVLIGVGLLLLGLRLEGRAEQVFEGLATLTAAGLLTWMIIWLQARGKNLKADLESKTTRAAHTGKRALFSVAFLAVFREGLELALFLLAATFIAGGTQVLIGVIIGLSSAVLLGWAITTYFKGLSLSGFFKVTNILLIFFAAGLVAYGVHELNEAGWIPALIYPVWDINGILSDKSTLGLILKALFGYNGNPSLTEVISYGLYLAVMLAVFFQFTRGLSRAEQPT